MNLQTNDFFTARLVSQTLFLLDKESLKEIYTANKISCFFLTSSNLFYATLDCEIFSLNIFSLDKFMIFAHFQLTSALFYNSKNLYLGFDNGKIIKYLEHEDEGEFVYQQIKEYQHNAPITALVSDGEDIVVSDMKNRTTVYPKCIQYDLKVTQICNCVYVFISESNKLFCKTRQALASLLETETKIHEFRFNTTGSLLFIRLFDRIQVYNTNTRELIKEIEFVVDNFYYCDKLNSLIGWVGKEVRRITGVVDKDYGEMKGITFDKSRIEVKTVGVPFEEYELVRVVGRRVGKDGDGDGDGENYKRSNKGTVKENENGNYKEKDNSKSSSTITHTNTNHNSKLINLFKEETSPPEKKRKIVLDNENFQTEPSDTLPLIKGDFTLLWYSDEGYLTSFKTKYTSRVELKFYNNRLPPIEIEDSNYCCGGVFCSITIVLYSQSTLYFYNGSIKWSKNIRPKKVCVDEKYIVVYSDLIYVFDYTGEEVFNFYVGEVYSMCIKNQKLAIFSLNTLTVIRLLVSSRIFFIPKEVNWSYIGEDQIYYRIDKDLYMLSLGVSHRLLEKVDYPLIIVKNKLVCLKSKEHFLPVPHLEFREFVNNNIVEESSFEE